MEANTEYVIAGLNAYVNTPYLFKGGRLLACVGGGGDANVSGAGAPGGGVSMSGGSAFKGGTDDFINLSFTKSKTGPDFYSFDEMFFNNPRIAGQLISEIVRQLNDGSWKAADSASPGVVDNKGNIIKIGTISDISKDAEWYDPKTGLSGGASSISKVSSALVVIKSRQ